MRLLTNRFILLSILLLALTAGLGACSSKDNSAYPMASLEIMPADVQAAPVTVQRAYQFAFANPYILEKIPSYCGCGEMGHTSNYACYVANGDERGSILYDSHALGCSICVDITHDVMRLLKDGKAVPDIRAYVDQTYSQFGPSNMP